MTNCSNANHDFNLSSKDALIANLKSHIKEMEQTEKAFERLNKKFSDLQKKFIHLSEEKTQMESELKKELSIENNKVVQFQHVCDSLQQELIEKNIMSKKQLKEIKALETSIDNKDDSITQLKKHNRQLKEDNWNFEKALTEYRKEQFEHQKQIEYLIEQNTQLTCEITNNNEAKLQSESIGYYEKELSESNYTIKKMSTMIKELENQIEDLQKEVEKVQHSQLDSNRKKKKKHHSEINTHPHSHNDMQTEYEEIIKLKEKHIKKKQNQIEILIDEKNKLIEDNTKMFSQIAELRNHLVQLDNQNKKLKQRLQLMANSEVSFRKYTSSINTHTNNQLIQETETFIDTNDYNENTIENQMTINSQYNDNEKTYEELSD